MRLIVMKKMLLLVALTLLLSAVVASAAEYVEPPLVPLSPSIMAQGGSAVATAHGYDSFFYNPAGFSRGKRELVIPGATMWLYARPDDLLAFGMAALTAPPAPAGIIGLISSQVTGGGFGAGASAGIGYVGDGLGLGMVFMADSLLRGPTLLGLSGTMTATLGFIGGLSFPLELGSKAKIHLGVDIRPMLRFHVPLTNTDAISLIMALASGGDLFGALNSASVLYGVGIGLDAGVIAELGPLLIGISSRDIGGTRFQYRADSMSTLMSTLGSQGRLPTGALVTDTYSIPMEVSVGIAFHPNLGSLAKVLDPSFQLDCQDIVGVIRDGKSPWSMLHAGLELALLKFFSLRAGLDQGYITFGGGLKLFFLDLNAAVFTRELGAHLGDIPNAGATVELALRF
jgi:hypothetical protein